MKRRNFLITTLAGVFSGKIFAQTNNNNNNNNNNTATTNIETNPILNIYTTQNSATKKTSKNNPLRGTSADPRHLPPISAPNVPTVWNTYDANFEIKTNKKVSSIWIPLPMIQTIQSSLYQKLLTIEIAGNFKKQRIFNQYKNNYHILNAVYYENNKNNKNNKNNNKDADDNYDSNAEKTANLSLNFTIQTADRHTDFSKRNVAPERVDILKYYLENSALIPNDTTAKNLATKIVNRIKDPIAKARAIFDWIVENSTYEMENSAENNTINERGNVRKQLENQSINNYHFRGRSADLNGLFVSLCRSIGIPARSVCGQRIAKSKLLPCLGIQDDVRTDLQHTRAEFYSPGCGWIPIDVSDVKRAEYFKTPELELKMLQTLLFGFWEMNWFAFGFGNEVMLNNTNHKIAFFDKVIGEQIKNNTNNNLNNNSQLLNFDNNEININTTQQYNNSNNNNNNNILLFN